MTRAEIENLLALAEKSVGNRDIMVKFSWACSPDTIADLCRSLIAAEQSVAAYRAAHKERT